MTAKKWIDIKNKNVIKPIILCIVGESGTGKSTIAQMLTEYGFHEIQSHTDRPKRTPTETGHTFHTKKEFDKINKSDMIAYTVYGGHRYCSTARDLKSLNTYVIDERGLNELKTHTDKCHVLSLRIYRSNINVDEERKIRNLNEYKMPANQFNYVLYNEYDLDNLKEQLDNLIKVFIEPDIKMIEG